MIYPPEQKEEGMQRRGSDIHYELKISAQQAREGITTNVTFPSLEACEKCQGIPFSKRDKSVADDTPCLYCGGLGLTARERRLRIQVPRGILQTGSLRVKGEGDAGLAGGERGDLLVVLQVAA